MAEEENERPVIQYANLVVTFRYTRCVYVVELLPDGTPMTPKKVGFDLNHTSMHLSEVLPTLSPRTILAVLKYKKDKVVTYILVWDLEQDLEVDSVETSDEHTAIILGESGPHGYLLTSSNEVISIDKSMTLTMFQVSLANLEEPNDTPLMMSRREDYFVF